MPFFNLPSSGSGSAAMLSGSGAPASSLGSNGAFYLDTANKKLYGPKTAGAWGSGIALSVADWAEITSKPTTFAPSAHTHSVSDVTGLQTALDGKQASGSYAASTHSHAISDVTGLQTALDGKAATSHTHTIANVTGLQTALDGKQATGTCSLLGHTHLVADVTGLQTQLDGKADSSHTHTIANVIGLQTALDGKQAAGNYATLVSGVVPSSQLPSYVDDVLEYATLPATGETGKIYVNTTNGKIYRWSGSAFIEVIASPGTTDAIAEGSTNLFFTSARAVAALQTALDGKQAAGNYATLVSSLVPVANLPLTTKTTAGACIVGGGLTVTSGTVSVEVAPGAPTSITDGGGTLSWTASTTGTSAAYDVQQTTDSGATYTTYFSNVTGTSVGNFDSSRKFRVRAKNAAGVYGSWGYQSGLTAQVEAKNLTIGSGFSTTDGTLTVSGSGYTLPAATASSLGGVKIGSNVSVSGDGTISVAAPVTTLAASAITGLATVATTGKYSDLSGTPSSYSLPTASASVLGGVKIGSNVSIAGDGTISVAAPYTLPAPTASTIGGVKAGTNITIASDGTISAASGGGSYTLPAATGSTLGGIIVGTGLSIASGVLSVSGGGSGYTLPVATVSVLGGVKTGSNVTIAADGTISVAAPTTDASALTAGTLAAARLPLATTSAVGGVIVGGGLSVSSGTISADLRSNTSGITGAAAISNIVSLTAAQYAALGTKNSSTLYIVAG